MPVADDPSLYRSPDEISVSSTLFQFVPVKSGSSVFRGLFEGVVVVVGPKSNMMVWAPSEQDTAKVAVVIDLSSNFMGFRG